MKLRPLVASLSWNVALLLLRICSVIIPMCQRDSWRKEWLGELWQVRGLSRTHTDLLRFAAGALPDAICLLFAPRAEPCMRAMPASRCLAVLTSVAALATGIALSLPSVRAEFRQMYWVTPGNLVVLFLPNGANEAAQTITPERYLLWKKRAPYLQKLGFYQVVDRVVVVEGRPVRLHVAHIAGDLARMVGGGDLLQRCQDTTTNRLILSERAWRHYLHAEHSVEGKSVSIDGRSVRVAGTANLEDSGLPGEYDAWLFDDQPLQPEHPGFVIGSFAAGTAVNPYFGFQHFSIRETQEFEISGLAFPVADRKANPWSTLGLGLALSLLALPATTPLGFGDKVRVDGRASYGQVVRRWMFMSLKCLAWAILATDAALVAATIFSRSDWRFAVTTRILVAFAVMLMGLRWSIYDQRRRCPVCLKQLTHPARVGEPSRNFLSWNGTELVCESGHGLMHVPAHATSWFGAQRWLALDSSWEFLFAHKR